MFFLQLFPRTALAKRLMLLPATVALCLLATMAAGAATFQQTEIIALKHRPASDLVAAVRPLVEPAGSVTAMQDQLIVRTSPANMLQVKKVVAALDREPRRLLISMRQDSPAADSTGGRVDSTRALEAAHGAQQVQVVEGARAFMETGTSAPVSNPTVLATTRRGAVVTDSTSLREAKTGFFVLPTVMGERVTLEVSTRRELPGNAAAANGSNETQSLATTVLGRLGEWIAIGGNGQTYSGPASQSWRTSTGERQLWLKVEVLH